MTGPVFSFDRDADFLLVVSPTWLTRMPPLGVAYLVTYLKSRGHRVEVADLNVELFNNASEQTKRLWDIGTINGCPPREIADKVLDQARSTRARPEVYILDTDTLTRLHAGHPKVIERSRRF